MLHESAQYICLTGDGPVPARAMLVGEAPGLREEEESKPFVGKAGQYLDEVMERCNLSRDDVFISNVVKCRPPGNRTPKTSEVKACHDFLVKEVEAVNPDYIMALGGVALKALTGRGGVTRLMGSWTTSKKDFGSRRVFICMHPSGVLRQEFYKSKFEFSIQQFSNIVQDRTSTIKTDYQLVTSPKLFRKAIADIKAADVVAWDIENSGGFNPYHKGSILCIGFATRPGKAWVFPLYHPQMRVKGAGKVLDTLKEILEAKKPKKVAQNGQYERKWMLHIGINPRLDFDTKIAAYLLDENGPTGLKPLAKALCQAPDWDEGIDWETIPPLKKLWPYNATDADYTLRLYYLQRKKINALPELARLMKFLMLPAADILAEVEYRGMAIDRERLNKRSIICQQKIWEVEKKLRAFIPPRIKITQNRKGKDCVNDKDFGTMPINWNSTKFLGWFLYKLLGLPLTEITETGRPGTREAVLMQIKGKHSAVATILEYREWVGRQTKFINSWTNLAIDHGKKKGLRLHTTYNLTKMDTGGGTDTGRLSSKEPNMQQVPRESFIRAIVTATPGWRFGEADLSQVELRIAGWLADEDNMKKKFIDGVDIHRATAADVSGLELEEIDKETRKKAKAINFGFLYGMYPKKFQLYAREKYQIEVTLEEAKAARNKYFNSYPKLLDWHEKVRRRVMASGYVKSPIGRRRRLPHIHSVDTSLKNQAERQAINSPVQSLASDFTLLSMIILRQKLSPKYFRMVGQVHDAILFEYKGEYEGKVCSTVKKVMENLPLKRLFGVTVPVPIEVEISIGTHWSEGKLWRASLTSTI